MIITTTSTIDGYQITQYFTPVVASVVAGTGLLTDMVAGLTDTFGGRSGTYQQALSNLYLDAARELQEKVVRAGGTAAVGASFDFSQISGKGMQMFMINAVATPVIVKTLDEIAADAAASAQEKAARQEELALRATEWAKHLSEQGPLHALLNDVEISEAARRIRRMYGNRVCADFLTGKAKELGLAELDLHAEDIPDQF